MEAKHVLSLGVCVLIAIGSYIILSDNKPGSAADVDETERNEKKQASQQLIESILKEQLNPLLIQTNNDKTEIIASYNEYQSVDIVKTELIEYKQASQEMVENINNIKTKIESSMDTEANIIQQQDDENKKQNVEDEAEINEQQQASKTIIKDDFEAKENKQNEPSDSNRDNVSNLNSKWDVESYQKQWHLPSEVHVEFIDNDQVIVYGKGYHSWGHIVLIKKENNQKSFKCKLIKLPNQSDLENGDSKHYKLIFGLFHKDYMYIKFDAFDILNGQIQDIDYVFYLKQDHEDYNDATICNYKLNGKLYQNTQWNTNRSWDKNWYNDKIKEGDIFELIIKEEEKKLILIINDKEAAHLIVKADYPINQVHVGFKFHIYPTEKPTIIQIL